MPHLSRCVALRCSSYLTHALPACHFHAAHCSPLSRSVPILRSAPSHSETRYDSTPQRIKYNSFLPHSYHIRPKLTKRFLLRLPRKPRTAVSEMNPSQHLPPTTSSRNPRPSKSPTRFARLSFSNPAHPLIRRISPSGVSNRDTDSADHATLPAAVPS